MKRWKKIVLGSIAALVLTALGLFLMILHSMRPTTGSRIAAYAAPRAALLVVDIQEDYTGPQARRRYHDGERIVATSNALIVRAQAMDIPVIFIQNVVKNPVFSLMSGGINAPGAPGTEMDRRLTRTSSLRTFTKFRSDAFSNPELDAFLRQNQVDRLLITGLDAAYCVNATALGALNRGYRVTLYLDGLATESGTSLQELSVKWQAAGMEVRSGSEI